LVPRIHNKAERALLPSTFSPPSLALEASRAEAEAQTPRLSSASPTPVIIAATANSPSCEPASPRLKKGNRRHPGQAKREPGSFQTQVGVFYDPVSAAHRSTLRRARDDSACVFAMKGGALWRPSMKQAAGPTTFDRPSPAMTQ